ncbi:hypothetical protein BDW75DRAFT_103611 [Aspergillus navahoensis]
MASQPKSHVFRVTGLLKGQSDKNLDASLLETLNNSLTPEEQSQIQADVTIVPSCYKPDTERVGLVRFRGGVPRFLSALTADPLGTGRWRWEILTSASTPIFLALPNFTPRWKRNLWLQISLQSRAWTDMHTAHGKGEEILVGCGCATFCQRTCHSAAP